jgi:hypothetical protein
MEASSGQTQLSADEMLAVLRESRDDDLIGLEESTVFDAKSGAYRLDDPKSRWELAKDVSAMANADGGILLIGAKTERLENSFVERVAAIRPVPTTFLNEDQLRGAVAKFLFPSIGNYVEFHRFDRGDDSGLLAIRIRRPPDDDQPILVTTRATVEVDGRTHEIDAWAIARRVGSGTEWDQGAKVWADIRDGRLARRSLTMPQPLLITGQDRVQERLVALLDQVGADDYAWWALAAYPTTAVRLGNFAGDDGAFGLLRSLPANAVRRNGFGLGYGTNVQALGSGLADIEPGRRGLLVDPDGLVLAVALGTCQMLGWSHQSWSGDVTSPLKINRFIVSEWPLEFTRFVDRVRSTAPQTAWELYSRASRLQSGLPPQRLHLAEEWMFDGSPPRVDDAEMTADVNEPEADAGGIVSWFVGLFGRQPSEVPAVESGRVVGEMIRAWR